MQRILLLSVLLLLNGYFTSAQTPALGTLNAIASRYYQAVEENAGPAILIHVDKPCYTGGETLWYAVHLVQDINRRSYHKENTLLVQLLNQKDSLCLFQRLRISSSALTGSFVLPDDWPTGSYKLLVYTPAMEQAASGLLGIAHFLVAGVPPPQPVAAAIAPPITQPLPPLRFSCQVEGQALISGVENPVVCTAYDASGQPVQLKGVVRNAVGAQVLAFQTQAQGLSKFSLNAGKSHKYSVTAEYNRNTYTDTIYASGPLAGQVILTAQNSSRVKARVALSDSLYKRKALTHLLCYSAGKVQFAASGSGMYEVDIPLKDFPRGLATAGLYNDSGSLISSRSFWVAHPNLEIRMTSKTVPRSPREAVMLQLQFTDHWQQPIPANFSVSVSDASFFPEASSVSDQEQPYLLNPVYYLPEYPVAFIRQIANDSAALDQLFLASSRLHVQPPIHPRSGENPFRISGKAFHRKGNPLAAQVVTLMASQGGSVVLTDTTDMEGNFSFSLPEFFGTVLFSFQVSQSGMPTPDAVIRIQPNLPPPVAPEKLARSVEVQQRPTLIPAATQISTYTAMRELRGIPAGKVALLPTVTVTGQPSLYNEIIGRKRVSKNSWIATPEMIDQAGEGNLGNVILGAPGVMMMNGFVTIQGGMRGISGIVNAKVEPLVVVNGVQVSIGDVGDIGLNTNVSPVLNYINTFSNRNVEFIEVLTGSQAAQYGTVGGNGVILIYTSANARTGINDKESTLGLPREFVEGYHLPEAFPAIDYTVKPRKSSSGTDRRITIYWNAHVQTANDGKAELHFFNSDYPGPLRVEIKGVAANGELFSKTLWVAQDQ